MYSCSTADLQTVFANRITLSGVTQAAVLNTLKACGKVQLAGLLHKHKFYNVLVMNAS